MVRNDERQLTRWLAGELTPDEERRLRRRLADDPALAREAERLRRTWDALEEPSGAAEAVPPGFSGRVMARVREEAATPRLSWSAAPGWARAAGAAALVVGLFLGAGLGGVAPGELPGGGPATVAPDDPPAAPTTVSPSPAPPQVADAGPDVGPVPAPEPSGAAPRGAEAGAADPAAADLPTAAPPTAGAPDAATRVARTDPDDLEGAWQDLYYGDDSGDGSVWGGGFGSLGDGYAAVLSSLGEGEDT